MSWKAQTRPLAVVCTLALFLTVGSNAASAQVQIMPDRDALSGTQMVVWGNTTLAGGTPYSIDFGDGSPFVLGLVNAASQYYIAATHTYATALLQQNFTVTLTVGASSATATVSVFNHGLLTPAQLENTEINLTIEDGLRYLYFAVDSREAAHDAGWALASWQSGHRAYSSMAVLAFENHGHNATTGDIYAPVVQAGQDYIFSGLVGTLLSVEPAGNPCVGPIVLPCNGLRPVGAGPDGYSTSIVLLAIAGSGTPAAIVGPGVATGQTYLEVAQRLVNTVAWGQEDSSNPFFCGGWRYGLNVQSDGSAIGWNVRGLLDAQAFGAVIPGFIGAELEIEDGRVNEISFTADDGKGGTADGSVQVAVPHDQRGVCNAVDSGQAYDATGVN